MRAEDERYFERLETRLDEAFAVATAARKAGGDPVDDVEIPVAKDMADRVENLLGIPGVADRVRELESQMSREEAALALAADFADGSVGEYETRDGKIEGAVRTAVALLTEGVVAAPIEGIDRVELATNDDGSEFVRVFYAGPIRSAGGTAQALSVLVADYTRSLLDVEAYRPRADEIERYVEEVGLYDAETGLQYSPTDDETRFIASNCPICLDGEATGGEEVSGFRDLERVNTNRSRGGMCLVLAEGIALKAPKIERYTTQLDEVDWPWLDDLIEGTVGKSETDEGESADSVVETADSVDESADGVDESAGSVDEAAGREDESIVASDEPVGDAVDAGSAGAESGGMADASAAGTADATADAAAGNSTTPSQGVAGTAPDGPARVDPASKYLRDLIAGRPVFSHPSRPGGFRLRYGRARNHGFATAGVHPATMHLVDDFLATGTQIKTERPGKAAGVVPVDTIEGPTVRLANGEVRRIDDPAEALEIRNGVERILDVGEYLVNVGEFVENNHPLAPASYTYEWWIQEFEATDANVQALADDPHVDLEAPSPERAIEWAIEYDAPLHPRYTYLWHDISVQVFEAVADAVEAGTVRDGMLLIERTPQLREAVESLLVEHVQTADELRIHDWLALVRSLGFSVDGETIDRTWSALSQASREWAGGENAVAAVNEVAPFRIRERAPTRIGNRMGRPEKSETRELSPAVHTLFPIGEAGGSQRDVSEAASYAADLSSAPGEIEVEVGQRRCETCDVETFRCRCPECGDVTTPHFACHSCGRTATPDESGRVECPRCEVEVSSTERRTIDVGQVYHDALESVGERESAFPILKGVKGLTSAAKTPEPMEKGVLRAKHGVSTFKDGTIRYDMTDLPVTAVHPAELDVSVDQFRELGYHEDIHGEPLVHDDQLVELRVQDIVLSDGAAAHLLKIADFVDDLLEKYYGLEPFYEVEERDDLVGELVFGMAPHTSAAVVGRVVGFTSAAVGYAHPYFHASKRRNCFHPETKVWYRDEEREWHYEAIETLVEERLEDPWEDDFGTLVEGLDSDVIVPSVDDEGSLVRKRIEAVSKHRAPDHLIQFESQAGRSLTVTPDHPVLRWDDDGALKRIEASTIDVGDRIPFLSDDVLVAGTLKEMVTGDSSVATDGGRTRAGVDIVERVQIVASDVEHTYSITVEETNTFVANEIPTANCDGDEDCIMLLLDGLLNFSRSYLPSSRGGRMDAPLVMSSRIDPAEIDDEAHNMDVVERYPKEFYESTLEMADPGDVPITLAEESVGTDLEYTGFAHTHDTSNIALGPDLSAYKTLGSMMDKMDAQLELARKLRAVDQTDVAERVIEYHFLPDLIGNLRAFARQETRCHGCGKKYRRVPLSRTCRECGGDVGLTVHRGSVTKYMDAATRVAEQYDCREYTKQRLALLDETLESVFENDHDKPSTLAEFM